MGRIKTLKQAVLFSALMAMIASCDLSDEIDERRAEATPTPAEEITELPEESSDMEALPEAVAAKRDEILSVLERDSVRQMVYLADDYEDFRSNYGDLSHYEHWYILRRAGIDPVAATQQILNEPYGVKDFGVEIYYIWPAFAARTPEELSNDRLTFSERARLLDLIGEDGIARLAAGESYPGFRLAIRQDGTWGYLLQDN